MTNPHLTRTSVFGAETADLRMAMDNIVGILAARPEGLGLLENRELLALDDWTGSTDAGINGECRRRSAQGQQFSRYRETAK